MSRFRVLFALVLTALIVGFTAQAQTITTGDIVGVVSDATGAVVPNATVQVREVNTGDSRSAQSGATGAYRISLLKPGTYQVSSSIQGLKSDVMSGVVVSVGQVQTLNLMLKPEASKSVITVTDAAPLLQTENANLAATYTAKDLASLPTPGGDITTVAFTVPGVAVSTGAGYGNFSSHGLPGTSNLFTTNGNDNMDPYMNLNNSGASNMTLGQNEIDQASVIQNGYSAQYGRQAGAQVNYITKSGSNAFHSDLKYSYNGSALNANDFFNNLSGTPKGRALSNQYAASLGGRILRDKLFFFVDTEGLRYTMPTAGFVSVPSQALQSYVLGNVSSSQAPFYQKMFNLYNNAPGRNRGIAVVNGDGSNPMQDSTGNMGCGTLAGTAAGNGGIFGQNVSCADVFGTNVSNQNTEWLLTSRADYNINQNQKLYFRFKTDHGQQPTETSPISPLFNAISNQPAYEGQATHTWVVSPRMVNNFIGSASWYSAIFAPTNLNASLGAFPAEMLFYDGGADGSGGMTQMGLSNDLFPQGRRVGQLQIVDDLSFSTAKHTIKAGVNYRYNRLTDTGNERLLHGGRYIFYGLDEFANGAIDSASGSNYSQRFTPYPVVHLRLYNLGFYLQDEWAVAKNLKITAGLRFDRNGNPNCTDNCFALFTDPFDKLQKGSDIPYNQSIRTGLSNAFYNVDAITPQPRLGVVYSPGSKGTVIRGGIGLFSDAAPGILAGSVFQNSPNVFTPSVRTGTVNSSGAGSSPDIAVATGNAFQTGFSQGYTLAQMRAALSPVSFTTPGFFSIPSTLHNPKYVEWSFEVEQQVFSPKNVLTLSYVGNHGYDLFLRNLKANGSSSIASYGLPSTAPDPRFRVVTDLTNNGISNYNGLSVSLRRGWGFGFQGQFAYTWSHSLDDVSNGGLTLYYGNDSLTSLNDPRSTRLNYSNSDYDIRHNVTADFSWEIPGKYDGRVKHALLSGWTLGSKWYIRTGTPFSVYNSRIAGRLSASVGGNVLAALLDPNVNASCSYGNTPCFQASQFATTASQTNFGNLPRNAFRAPGYFDTDASINKTIPLATERVRFTVGATVSNLFNHANFASPGQDVSASGFGVITSTVSAPTSPYGTFMGSAVSGRVVVLTGRLSF